MLKIDPTGEMGELGEERRIRIAAASFRKRWWLPGGRHGLLPWCFAAFPRITASRGAEDRLRDRVAWQRRGLDVNSPAEQYRLESILGRFSGLHLLCIQYVGFQILNPSLDLGFDLSAEYQAALQMHQG